MTNKYLVTELLKIPTPERAVAHSFYREHVFKVEFPVI